ncbi:hypothetical protein ACFVXE_27795 [Streptomyces sp. NPDC058231]|uniref:hypothetical protein n=1 Tax=Streptomyces sp. NPDC058231 TaxID=3346392 RepID=UPI0036E46B4D
MLVGAVDIYANHPVVLIGSTDPPELDWDNSPACSDGKHIVVQTRGQSALTRVSIWNRAMPAIGDVVFDGVLNVEGSRVCVSDVENLTRWVTQLVRSGSQRVVVYVDDPGHASRVHVGFGLGDRSLALTAVTNHPLPLVRVAPDGQLLRPNELGLILDGHDSPLARLAAAIKVLALPVDDRPWPNPYYIRLVTQWLRGLDSRVSLAEAEALGQEIAGRLRPYDATATDGIRDVAAWMLATHVVDRIGLR